MRIDWDVHAERRMHERKIARAQAIRALTHPDRVLEGNQPGRMVAERDTSMGNVIRVVYSPTANGFYVWTVMRRKQR